jgi:hypothetical protein
MTLPTADDLPAGNWITLQPLRLLKNQVFVKAMDRRQPPVDGQY